MDLGLQINTKNSPSLLIRPYQRKISQIWQMVYLAVLFQLILIISGVVNTADGSTSGNLEWLYSQDGNDQLQRIVPQVSKEGVTTNNCSSFESRIDRTNSSIATNNVTDSFQRQTKMDYQFQNHSWSESFVRNKTWPPWPTLLEGDIVTDKDRAYYNRYNHLPKRATFCDNVKLPSFDFTIVTALINLRREEWPKFRRQFDKYLYYAARMLDFHVPMVIYVESDVVDFVEYHRQGKEHITHIIPVSVRDLEYYKYHTRVQEIMQSDVFKKDHFMLHHPEGFSADYNILMNSKHPMLFVASVRDYFQTNYFYWMDVGYGHGNDIYPKSCYWSPKSIMNDVNQITYIQLNPLRLIPTIQDLYKKFLPPFLNGAFFGGPKISVKRYYFLHKEVFEDFLDSWMVDDDQTLAVACYLRRPILFNIVEGWWYDAFELFT